jgi:uncharacterized membrane protein YcgQ (UPF0703/DUF1980 family)
MDKPFIRWRQLNSDFRFFVIPTYVLGHIPLYIAYPGYSNYNYYYFHALYFLGFICVISFILSKTVLSELDIRRYRRGIVYYLFEVSLVFLFLHSISLIVLFGSIEQFKQPAIALAASYLGTLSAGIYTILYFNVLGSYLRYRR